MLLRMYMRWAEKQGFKCQILEQRDGEAALLQPFGGWWLSCCQTLQAAPQSLAQPSAASHKGNMRAGLSSAMLNTPVCSGWRHRLCRGAAQWVLCLWAFEGGEGHTSACAPVTHQQGCNSGDILCGS